MKSYTVEVVISDYFYDSIVKVFLDNGEPDKVKRLDKILGEHKITTFEEYTKLLEKVTEINNEYHIYNYGTHIELFP